MSPLKHITPTRSNAHLHRPNDRALAKQPTAGLHDVGPITPGSGMLLPGLVDERKRMFIQRLRELQKDMPIRNATVTCKDPYKTGDGDCFHQPPRDGSLVAFGLPSRGMGG